jgi:ribosomal protein S27E
MQCDVCGKLNVQSLGGAVLLSMTALDISSTRMKWIVSRSGKA